jgi:hypothetical protein
MVARPACFMSSYSVHITVVNRDVESSIQQHGLGVFDNKELRTTFRLPNNIVK